MPRKPSPQFAQYPLFWIAVAFAAGIICAKFCGIGLTATAAVCIGGVVLTVFWMPRTAAAATLFASFWALGGICFQVEVGSVANDRLKLIYDRQIIESGEPVVVEGSLIGLPEPSYDGVFLLIAAQQVTYRYQTHKVTGDFRIFVSVESAEAKSDLEALHLENNSKVRISCNPEREERYQNPGVRSRIQSLDEQGIDAVATLKSPLLIEKTGNGSSYSITGAIFGQRQRLIEEFRTRFDTRTAGVLIASLLGNKYFLDKQTADLFREGGTFHILVISGLHITFIGGLVVLIVAAFTRNRIWQFLIAAVFLWSYTIAVGAEIPVVRACTVFTILLFSRVIYRQGSLLNSLGACALLLLAFHPSSLFTPSFQLTFISVGAIVAIAFPMITGLRKIGEWMPGSSEPLPPMVSRRLKRFCETLYWRDVMWTVAMRRQIYSGNLCKRPYVEFDGKEALQKVISYLFEGLLVSLIVQICLLPPAVFYFHRVSIAGVVLNLWVGVVLAIETLIAIAAVLVAQVSTELSQPLVKLAELFNSLLLAFPTLTSDTNLSSFRIPIYSGIESVVYLFYFLPVVAATVVIFQWDPFKRHKPITSFTLKLASILLIVCALGIMFHPFSSPRANGNLSVDFLDVGQGDAALVTFPNGETMLVDGGGRPNFRNADDGSAGESFEPDVPRIGEAVVSEFLWQKGYSRVDYLVTTHADADHIQGLADVAANFDVGKAFIGREAKGDTDYDALMKVLRRKRTALEMVSAGDVFEIGGARVEIFNPTAGEAISDNDNSVVIRISFGGRAFLLTGDIERAGEMLIVDSPINADVVKVPHHGSRTSSTNELIVATRARFAIISVGKRSRFGHPHPEVLERWKAAGAEVLTTGQFGTISISTDGMDLWFERFSEK